MTEFKKPALTVEEHIDLLRQRGLDVADTDKAIRYLRTIGYYRLSAYSLPFHSEKDQFAEGTSFDDVLSLYIFDRKLRLLVMDGIERIEVAVRSAMSDQLCSKYNPHWFLVDGVFIDEFYEKRASGGRSDYTSFINKVSNHTGRTNPKNRNTSCKHYYDTYSKPPYPPSWMIVEVLPMGTWSKVYENLESGKVKQKIAKTFRFKTNDFGGWLHSLTLIRNRCAHHSRFWNTTFPPKARNIQKYTHSGIVLDTPYTNLALIQAFLIRFLHNPSWSKRLGDHLLTCPLDIHRHMNVPYDWDCIDFWK
jgi:abortive infection bacteriophage resistance protein